MKLLCFIIFIFLFSYCTNSKKDKIYTQAEVDSLIFAFDDYIQNKDNDFKTAQWSPLTDHDKLSFEGLHYYPYDISFRFEGPIIPYTVQDSLTIMGSKAGDLRPAIKYGFFEFEKDQQDYRLDIIKILPREPRGQSHLFLGFWDETSDNETYGGGRYVELEQGTDNRYIVDFNFAYNPYCAYSERYSCAIPPLNNRLTFKLTCGEKKYREH